MDELRCETEWEGMRLIVERRWYHFQAFVYHPGACELLYTAERMSLDEAKFAVVDFATAAQFGAHHDLKAEVIAGMLVWNVA